MTPTTVSSLLTLGRTGSSGTTAIKARPAKHLGTWPTRMEWTCAHPMICGPSRRNDQQTADRRRVDGTWRLTVSALGFWAACGQFSVAVDTRNDTWVLGLVVIYTVTRTVPQPLATFVEATSERGGELFPAAACDGRTPYVSGSGEASGSEQIRRLM
jgi:hypothetical protein